MPTDYVAIASLIGVLLLPTLAVAELVFKGGEAGRLLMVRKADRTSVECFLDKSLHFRKMEGTNFSLWKIGVRNLTTIPARSLNLTIISAEALGEQDNLRRDCASETIGMRLEPTHNTGKPRTPMSDLITTASFDLVETGNDIQADRMRIFHNTADPNNQSKILRSIGLLPLGKYGLTLCLECENADSKYYSVELNHTPQSGMTLQWNGECNDPTAATHLQS